MFSPQLWLWLSLLIISSCQPEPPSPSPYTLTQKAGRVQLETATGAVWAFPKSTSIVAGPHQEMYLPQAVGSADLRIYEREGLTAYDLIVPPGQDPHDLQLPVPSVQSIRLRENGELVIADQGGYWVHAAPIAYQDLPEGRRSVAAQFDPRPEGIGFRIGQYHPDYPLIIDPTIQFFMMPCSGAPDELGGRVFHDIDNNGEFDPMVEPGIENAAVRLYSCASETPVSTTTTDANGQYAFTGLDLGTRYRLEIEAPGGSGFLPAFAGPDNATTVQYGFPGSCAVNTGFVTVADYCSDSSLRMVLPCYESGSGVGNNNAVMVSFGYSASGSSTPPQVDFTAAELGSVFGTAFLADQSLVYTSAFLKRHSGLGPRGLDGLYALDYSGATPTLAGGINFQGVVPANGGPAVDLGTINRNNVTGSITGPFDLSNIRTESTIDLDAFAKVGTVGFGDIDRGEDGRYLWMVNLHQRAILKVQVDALSPAGSGANTPPSSAVEQFPLDGAEGLPECTNGVLRPFGLELAGGRGYLGCVCDASGDADTIVRPEELTGHIVSFDTASVLSFTEELQFSFDYDREPTYFNSGDSLSAEWHRWIDTFTQVTETITGLNFVSAPQPIISDIEILDNGDMAFAVMDRFVHQAGTNNLTAQLMADSLVSAINGGDILYAERVGGNFILGHSAENDPGLPAGVPLGYPGFQDDDGPNGTGEFFWGDYFVVEIPTADEGHYEIATGGLAYQAGSNELAATVFDPVSFFSQGIRYFDLTTGGFTRNYRVLETDFDTPAGGGKGSSLGDPELICGVPGVQIGNYAWIDTDQDGIQDPCEDPLPGLTVWLYDMIGNPLDSTVTQEDGTYYFDSLARNTMYFVAFGDSSVIELDGTRYGPTTDSTGTGPQPRWNDSDPALQTGLPDNLNNRILVKVTTSGTGGANHHIDAGFIDLGPPIPTPCISLACPNQLNLTVNADCEFLLTPELLLRQLQVSPDEYEIRIMDRNGHLIPTDTVTRVHVGRTVTYMIYRIGCEEFPCYGKLKVEDKTGPAVGTIIQAVDTLECTLSSFVRNNISTTDPNSPYYMGQIVFRDNCAPDCATQTKFFDTYESFDCDSLPLTGRLVRRWTATDCNGLETIAEQYYYFQRPDLTQLQKGSHQTIQTCNPSPSDIPALSGPFWIDVFGDTLYLTEVECGSYATQVESVTIPICGETGSFKFHQFYRVFDWCTQQSTWVDTVTIEIGDFAAPHFSGNAWNVSAHQPALTQLQGIVDHDSLRTIQEAGRMPVLSTGPSDCTSAFSTLAAELQQQFGFSVSDCSSTELSVSVFSFAPRNTGGIDLPDTIWQQLSYHRFNNILAGLPIGVHALVVEASDDCLARGRGMVFFQVRDQIAPVMKCDDEVHVTLTNGDAIASGGYARVRPSSLEEGSWDNCAMGTLEIRREIPESCIPDFIAFGYDTDEDGFLTEADGLSMENGILYTAWEPFVEFFCCDLAAPVKVEVRGTDQAVDPLTGMALNNQSVCWLDVVVEDKVDPRLLAPPALTVDCHDPRLEDLQTFGTAQLASDHCGNMIVQELASIIELDRCGYGTITRRFQAIKNPGTPNEQISPTVSQTISVVERNAYSICFPEDVTAICGNDPTIPGVTYSEDACDLIAVSTEDNRFTATQDPDACYKIFRTYKVINWCEYDGEAQPTLINRDWDNWNGINPGGCANPIPMGDGMPGDEGICVIVRKNTGDNAPDTVYYDRDNDPYNNLPDNPATAAVEGAWWRVISGNADPTTEEYYEGNCSSWSNDSDQFDSDISGNVQGDDADIRYGSFGYWRYTQHIVVYDETPPQAIVNGPDIFCANGGVDCSGNISYTLDITDNCTGLDDYTVTVMLDVDNNGILDQDITPALDGNELNGRFPIGEHRIQFRINDGCGNIEIIDQVFEIEDCKAPTPICLSSLSISLMPTQDSRLGALPVFASELIASDIYDCSGQGEANADGLFLVTEYYLTRDENPDSSDLDPNRPEDHIILTCADLGQMVPVELHAMDEAGNHSYCQAFIDVQDNQNVCSVPETNGIVSGGIATFDQELVEGVEVQLSGGQSMLYQTDANGTFRFHGLQTGHDYTLIPRLDEQPLNGVSTFDLVLIQRHILGDAPLTNPYQLIAADVNNSGHVTTLDLIQLRKLVLNVDQAFTNNTSWRFVDADYRFPDPTNPWIEPFPEIRNINDLEGEMVSDFIAIKIGDVNGNALPNSQADVQSRSSESPYLLRMDDTWLEAEQIYQIPIRTDDPRAVPGLQFALKLNHIELIDLEAGLLGDPEVAWLDQQHLLTGSYVNQTQAPLTEEHLLTLHIRPVRDLPVREAIQIAHTGTPSEAYTEGGQSIPLLLQYGTQGGQWTNQLLPNEPNPWREQTLIPFVLQKPARYQLDLFDSRGRRIKSYRGEGVTGRNEVRIQADQLPGSGLYYYRLQAAGFSDTQSMLYKE